MNSAQQVMKFNVGVRFSRERRYSGGKQIVAARIAALPGVKTDA